MRLMAFCLSTGHDRLLYDILWDAPFDTDINNDVVLSQY